MKRFFARNRKLVEIVLTLVLVFLVAGYYYLIYIPAREGEIVARRFRTLQRIEQNMLEKMEGYFSTIENCLSKSDEKFFGELLAGYNREPKKFIISITKDETIFRNKLSDSPITPYSLQTFDSIANTVHINEGRSRKVLPSRDGRKITITYDVYSFLSADSTAMHHIKLVAIIDYKEFVTPLLRKNVFDHYIVFNVQSNEASNIVYEDFHSGISFNGLDSLFDAKEKVYTSRIIKIETGGEKYLAFLHPCGYNNKNDRIVAGLLQQERFSKEKGRLPDSMVTTIIFIALIVILLLPIIRLSILGKKERIRFFDLFTGYFSFLLLVPVIVLAFFWNINYFLTKKEGRNNSKNVLARQISNSLQNEVDSAYALLDYMDSLHAERGMASLSTLNIAHLNDSAYANYFELKEGMNQLVIETAARRLDSIVEKNATRYQHTEFVFWLDSEGKEQSNWAFGADPPRGKYTERVYFQNVIQNRLITNDPGKNFTIEPVVSRTDGKFKIVLAKHSRTKGMVVASASQFISVKNPVLPAGFSFSITDKAGKTIFDSDSTHNLNENLMEEFTNPGPFKAAVNTNTAIDFNSRYEDEEYQVLVQPISRLPYYIVIFHQESFDSSLKTQSFSFTLVMMFSFFIFLCLELIIVLMVNFHQTNLLKNKFELSWMYPRESLQHKYFYIFINNIAVLILLLFFCFWRFSPHRLTEYLYVFVMATLLTSIAACIFNLNNTESKYGYKKKKNRRGYTLIALVILACIALFNAWFYAFFQRVLLFTVLTSILIFTLPFLCQSIVKASTVNHYMRNFCLMVFSRLLLTSGLPVVVFFSCIYNFEERLEARFKLLDYAGAIEKHISNDVKLSAIITQINGENNVKGFYTDSAWVVQPIKVSNQLNSIKPYDDAALNSTRLLKKSRLHYNNVSQITENFELMKPFGEDNNQFSFNSIFSDTSDYIQYKIRELERKPDSTIHSKAQYLTITSNGFNHFKFPPLLPVSKGMVFWILIFASLYLSYRVLMYALYKIFGKNIPGSEDLTMVYQKLLSDNHVMYLFVQGIPGAGKASFLKNYLETIPVAATDDTNEQSLSNKISVLNFSEIPAEDAIGLEREQFEKQSGSADPDKNNWYYKESSLADPKISYILFTHFEYKMYDEFSNRIKLNLLEKICRLHKKKIIISSAIDPFDYFYSLKMFMNETEEKNTQPESRVDSTTSALERSAAEAFTDYINRWNSLLGRFANIYLSVEQPPERKPDLPFKNTFLNAECSKPAFLKNYRSLMESQSIDESNAEDYILKIQSLCYHSYRHIWYSLTKEEQLALYDLAEDGLMNTTNFTAVMKLYSKGLVIRQDGVLLIVNRSFRNFVLSVVNSREIQSIERQISDYNTWNDYKYPVLIILGALLYFVLSSNPEKFGNLLPIVSAVLAGIPTVTKLLSFMKPGDTKG